MNSNEETSPTSATSTSSNNSLPDATSLVTKNTLITLQEEDFLTAPLMGLCQKPLHLMTPQERENHVTMLRQLQQSAQTFKAEVEKAEEEVVKVKKVKGAAKRSTASEIDSLLE